MIKRCKAREEALKVLLQVEGKGAYLDLALKENLRKSKLGDRDKGLITEICYGVIRYLLKLDWYIEEVTGREAFRIDPYLRNILRLSLYQLIFLNKIPPSAACYEGVELAKKVSHQGGVKFVNGALRGFLRRREQIKIPSKKEDPLKYLSLEYSYPLWMVKRWTSYFGLDEGEEILKSNNQQAPLSVRVNTLKIQRKELKEVLKREGVGAEEGILPETLILKGAKALSSLESFQKGYFQVQGQSSMLVSHLLDPQRGERIMDCCSAPGGKASHMAQLMANEGRILCRDIHPHKLELIKGNARRLGISILEPESGDSRKLPPSLEGVFDRVLVDAPCSGLGIIRRKPDLKWKRKPAHIRELSRVQKTLLEEASKALKPGGTLLYSVCTNEPQETRKIFFNFNQAHQNFTPWDLSLVLPEKIKDRLKGVDGTEGFLNLYPHRHGLDGFFIARWTKDFK